MKYMRFTNDELLRFIHLNHFSPNASWSPGNPVLHCWLANESFDHVSRLLQLIPLRINPNLCDGTAFGKKSILILLTLLPSSGSLPLEFIDRYQSSLKFDYQDKLGRTALHYAVILGRFDLVNSLVKHGASIALTDHNNMQPFDYLGCHKQEIINALQMVDIEPLRDSRAKKNRIADHQSHHIMFDGQLMIQTKTAIDDLLAKGHFGLIKYIDERKPDWGVFIGDNSEATHDKLLALAKNIALEKEVPLSEVWVEEPLSAEYQKQFQEILRRNSSIFSNVSVLDTCLKGQIEIEKELFHLNLDRVVSLNP